MTTNTNKSRKIPIRSQMSDEELSALIKEAQEKHPEQFSIQMSGDCVAASSKFTHKSAVSEVISKWL